MGTLTWIVLASAAGGVLSVPFAAAALVARAENLFDVHLHEMH